MPTKTTPVFTERAADLARFSKIRSAGKALPFALLPLEHIYIKLQYKQQFENAANAADARAFLRSVTRAAMAAERLAEEYHGFLLEVQGSMLHVGLPRGLTDQAATYVSNLHA